MSRWVKCDAVGCTNEAGPLTESDELLVGWVNVKIEICVGHLDAPFVAEQEIPGAIAMLIGAQSGRADQHRRWDAFVCSADCLVRWAQERQIEIATARMPDAVE